MRALRNWLSRTCKRLDDGQRCRADTADFERDEGERGEQSDLPHGASYDGGRKRGGDRYCPDGGKDRDRGDREPAAADGCLKLLPQVVRHLDPAAAVARSDRFLDVWNADFWKLKTSLRKRRA